MTDHHPVGVALENRLMSHGIYITEWTRLSDEGGDTDGDREQSGAEPDQGALQDGTGFALEYETVSESPTVTNEEVGAVVRAFLSIADERDWDPGRLEATALTTDGELRGRWHIEQAWLDALGRELDELEFSQRVLETVRTATSQQ